MTMNYIVIAVGFVFLIATQYTIYDKNYDNPLRDLSSVDKQQIRHRTEPYSSPGSIAAVINTAKMGTGGLTNSFHRSWECKNGPSDVKRLSVGLCGDNRIGLRTHFFEDGSDYIQQHRRAHPEGQCLITTALRNPSDWFGSMYLQGGKNDWKSTEEMLRDYKEFLTKSDFGMLYKVLPDLLKEFNIDSLINQSEIMEVNGGYSLVPAPSSSALAGCDLLFLRMEQSDQWPDIFKMLDPELRNMRGVSRVDQNPQYVDQINAIESYELTSEEKINIYNSRGKFVQDWFDAYGYMDDVIIDESAMVERTTSLMSYSSPGSIAAVINTPKMGTGGLTNSITHSWNCKSVPPSVERTSQYSCGDNRIGLRTHIFDNGLNYIQEHRRAHPEGQCLIITALRNPSDWFGSMYLQGGKRNWKPVEEMLWDYKEFLVKGDFSALNQALPGLLEEFNVDNLIDQSKIMEANGGYSLIPAPSSNALAGCDLLFLRMEQSDQWPDIFKMLDPELRNDKGASRVDQNPQYVDQINAIESYELTSEEKINIYNSRGKFVQDWFDAYGYMDTVYE